jgi:copper chaperone CopZ
MNSIKKGLMAIALLLSAVVATAQMKNAKTETVKIFGNCGMCETTIEKAGTQKDIASVDWNKDTKMATLTYDSKITNKDEILKRIALVGYDSEQFRAEESAYYKLPGCCQYDRAADVKEEKESIVDEK